MFKRGSSDLVLWYAINFFILALVLLPMLIKIIDIKDNMGFEQRYLVKDIALLVNNIYASPNDLFLVYTENEFPFSVRFTEGKVEVLGMLGELNPKEFYFIEDENIEFVYREINPIEIDKGEEQVSIIPLGFKKKESQIEPFSYVRTSDLLGGDGSSDEIAFRTESGYYVVEAPMDTQMIATKPEEFGKTTGEYVQFLTDNGKEVAAAINGNYFNTPSDPNGVAAGDREYYHEDDIFSASFIVKTDGSKLIAEKGSLPDENRIRHAVSGQPVLIKDCEVQDFSGYDPIFRDSQRPRTVVGLDEKIFFVVFEAASLDEAANTLVDEVCDCDTSSECTMLNLDGGGSTSLILEGGNKIFPSGSERTVANHLVLLK